MKKKFTPEANLAQSKALMHFGVRYVLVTIILYGLLEWLPSVFVEPVNIYTATMVGCILKGLGMAPTVQGAFISLNGFSVKVIGECTALFLVVLFSAFVLAYPARWKDKAVGLLFGTGVLVAANNCRLVLIFMAGLKYPRLFEYVHIYFGQLIMVVLVFLASVIWLRTIVSVKTTDTPTDFFLRFVAFSSIPFLLWINLNNGYIAMNQHMIRFLFSLLGHGLPMPGGHNFFYATFNLIAFAALILATKSMERRRKTKVLFMGLCALYATHVVLNICVVLLSVYHIRQAFIIGNATNIVSQYIVPFLFWVWAVRRDLFQGKGMVARPFVGRIRYAFYSMSTLSVDRSPSKTRRQVCCWER